MARTLPSAAAAIITPSIPVTLAAAPAVAGEATLMARLSILAAAAAITVASAPELMLCPALWLPLMPSTWARSRLGSSRAAEAILVVLGRPPAKAEAVAIWLKLMLAPESRLATGAKGSAAELSWKRSPSIRPLGRLLLLVSGTAVPPAVSAILKVLPVAPVTK